MHQKPNEHKHQHHLKSTARFILICNRKINKIISPLLLTILSSTIEVLPQALVQLETL